MIKKLITIVLLSNLSGCQSWITPDTPPTLLPQPIKFLLTFDDGPSIANPEDNPTLSILKELAQNDIQPGIKAVFFVQTRNSNGGGTPFGRQILRDAYQAGHTLAVHCATPAGHVGHIYLSPDELDHSMKDAIADIHEITGSNPQLVRPPYWKFTTETQRIYAQNNLKMLLADVKANDGVIHIFIVSFRRRSHIRSELMAVREAILRGELAQQGCCVPVVVGFHDVNVFTASHMNEYLHILMEEAANVGLKTAAQPFYADRNDLNQMSVSRSVPEPAIAVTHSPSDKQIGTGD